MTNPDLGEFAFELERVLAAHASRNASAAAGAGRG